MQIQITDQTARRIYPTASAELKQILDDSFTKEFFTVDLWDKIKSFEDGLDHCGLNKEDILSIIPAHEKPFEISKHGFDKLAFLGDIFRNGWVADPTDTNQKKWYVWLIYKFGFGLSLRVVAYDHSLTLVASRLQFPTEEMARKFYIQFAPYFSEYHLNKKS